MKLTAAKLIFTALSLFLVAGCSVPSRSIRGGGIDASPLSSSTEEPKNTPKTPLDSIKDSLLFHPTQYPDGNWNPRGSNWDRGGLAFEDVWFQSADGTKLHAWYYPHPEARAVVLFCHGNAGNLSHRADLVRYLHDQHKLSLMIFDYRGYGRSEGTPDEQGVLDDARAARAWLAGREKIAAKDIVLMGRSLGGAVAVDLAASDGARGLILESTFTSVSDVANQKIPFSGSLVASRLNSLDKIGNYHGPLLQSHGDADVVIPYFLGMRLFKEANEPKTFVTISGGGHNHPQSVEYYRALDSFIDSLPPVGARSQAAMPNR